MPLIELDSEGASVLMKVVMAQYYLAGWTGYNASCDWGDELRDDKEGESKKQKEKYLGWRCSSADCFGPDAHIVLAVRTGL